MNINELKIFDWKALHGKQLYICVGTCVSDAPDNREYITVMGRDSDGNIYVLHEGSKPILRED